MKKSIFHQIATLVFTLSLGATAWAVPSAPASGPYVTDPQNEYVQDSTSDAIGSVNMVLCIVNAMNISGSGMLNVGPYIALIDMNKCQSHGSTSSSTGGSSGATAAVNYMTAVVNATRASSTAPMVAKVWMSMTENGSTKNIYVHLSATQSPADVPPYGVFRLDYIGYDTALTPAMQFNGFIDSTSGNLQFYETGSNSSNVALSMTAGSTSSGSGTMNTGVGTIVTDNFNYNSSYFRRNSQCFDRSKTNASRSVWRYGTYDATTGNRVDQANPSFQIMAAYGGNSYYGYAGYYGIGFQGLDLNGIADASPIPGLVVSDQRPGNTTTYNLSKVGGKLTKWSQNATTLSAMDGIPFNFSGDLTGKAAGGAPTNPNGWGNWQMVWDDANHIFKVIGTQVCGSNGCTVSTLTTPATINAGAFNGIAISGWSDSFGGSINIPPSAVDHVSVDAVNYFSQTTVIPGTTPLTLYCLSNCPDATSVSLANADNTGAALPFNATTNLQWFSAPNAGGVTVSYAFDSSGLNIAAAPMIISNASYFKNSQMYQYGVTSGRLFASASGSPFVSCFTGTAVCEPSGDYYTWTTGTAQWNQSLWLTKTSDSSVVAFDPPQNVTYSVPGTADIPVAWQGKTIQLQFNGFGNLQGIPGYCVDPVDNSQKDCSTPNVRYVPEFSIPDGARMHLSTPSTSLIVKALDAEIRFASLGVVGVDVAADTACGTMSLTPLTPPSSGTHDMSSSGDVYYIGAKPSVTAAPKVIDGVVQ